MQQIAAWLEELGMSEYAERFAENRIDLSVLRDLTDQDLKELGVVLGDRRKLLRAIGELDQGASTAGSLRAQPPQDAAERRQLTVMFCDLVGSTALSGRLDPEDLREVIGAYHRCCATTVERNGGFVAKYMGDGVLVYFGYPQAHEHDAERAVRTALALVEAVPNLVTVAGLPLHVRVGIATGLVVVGDLIGSGEAQERGVVGETPNLAARLQAIAEPGMVVIADDTRRLVRNLFELHDLGAQGLKGITAPIRAWAALRPSAIESRFEALRSVRLSPFRGRDDDLDLLMRRWQRAKSGSGQLVLLTGEPGIGKSRLISEFESRLSGEVGMISRYFCRPHWEQNALGPVVACLEEELGLLPGETSVGKIRMINAALADKASREDVALLAELLGAALDDSHLHFGPQRKRTKTFAALSRLIVNRARSRPLLIVVEDAHWVDPSSLEFFDNLIELLPTVPVLLVISFRPEFAAPWIGNPSTTLLALNRLGPQDASSLVLQLAADQDVSGVIDRIVAQADGIPLFIEELTEAMLERAGGPGVIRQWPAIPATLHASLVARLDRVPTARKVAQIGAVIGREFSYRLLAAIADFPEAQVAQSVADLVSTGLVKCRGTVPDADFTFKHALIQEAAYESLLRSTRKCIHAAIVSVLEGGLGDGMDPSWLGHHCAQAGLTAKAATYYRLAGEQSAARSAVIETQNQFGRALEHASNLEPGTDRDRLECELLLALGHVLLAAKGNADTEALAVFERAVALCRNLNDLDTLTRALYSQATILLHQGDPQTAQTIGEELLLLGRSTRNDQTLFAALVRLGHIACLQGRFTAARENLYDALEFKTPRSKPKLSAAVVSAPDRSAAAHLALALTCQGFLTSATARIGSFLADHDILPSSMIVLLTVASPKDDVELRKIAEAQQDLAEERGFPYFLALSRCLIALVDARSQRAEQGLAMIVGAHASLRALGITAHEPWALGLTSDAFAGVGRHSEALAKVEEALVLSNASGITWFDAELHRRKARLLLQSQADFAEVGDALQQAMSVAQKQSANLFELRAATDFALLNRGRDRRAEGRKLLASVYDRFTEGFDFPDLKNAKAALEESR